MIRTSVFKTINQSTDQISDLYGRRACADLMHLIITKGCAGSKNGGATNDEMANNSEVSMLTDHIEPPELDEEERRATYLRLQANENPYPEAVKMVRTTTLLPPPRKSGSKAAAARGGGWLG